MYVHEILAIEIFLTFWTNMNLPVRYEKVNWLRETNNGQFINNYSKIDTFYEKRDI